MCKKVTVAYGDYIGNRLMGWCAYNGKDYSFVSDKTVKNRINAGNLVNGLAVEEDKVVLDKTFANCLVGKSGLGFEPIMGRGRGRAGYTQGCKYGTQGTY